MSRSSRTSIGVSPLRIGSTTVAAAAEYSAHWPRLSRCSPAPVSRATSHAVQSGTSATTQLSLLPLFTAQTPVTEVSIEAFREKLLSLIHAQRRGRGAALELIVTNNSSTMISVRRGPKNFRLRLHRIFLDAGSRILRALGRYITDNDRIASAELSEFIEAHQEELPAKKTATPRATTIVQKGKQYDLQALFDKLNGRYFGGSIAARITWGRASGCGKRPRSHRSLKLGSYSVEDRLIRIHPTLDQAYVPSYFIEWIIYHEMLHEKHPIPVVAGRRRFHTLAFLAEERLFDDHERAQNWERKNLHRLLIF